MSGPGEGAGPGAGARAAGLRRWSGVVLRAAVVVIVAGFPFWMAPIGYTRIVFAAGLVAGVLLAAWLVLRVASRGAGPAAAGGAGAAEAPADQAPAGPAPVERRRVTRAQVGGALLTMVAVSVSGALLAWSLASDPGRFPLALAAFAALAGAVALFYTRVAPPAR